MSSPAIFENTVSQSRTRAEWALEYYARGWAIVPIPHGTKAPAIAGWQRLRFHEDMIPLQFAGEGNIGVLLGEASSGLLDVDLDCAEAVQLAPTFLPTTLRIHGRPGKPASHYWYLVTDAPVDPLAFKDVDGSVLLELRSSGQQTVVPPSIHPSGEQLYWEADGTPSCQPGAAIQRRAAWLASACILFRHWPAKGSRHDTVLALSGMLLKGGAEEAPVKAFINVICSATGDEEACKRSRDVTTTAIRVAAGSAVTERNRLAQLLGSRGREVVKRVVEWLGLVFPKNLDVSLTDAGNAQRFAEQHQGSVLFQLKPSSGCSTTVVPGDATKQGKSSAVPKERRDQSSTKRRERRMEKLRVRWRNGRKLRKRAHAYGT